MRYLLLIPAVVAMLASVLFWVGLAYTKFEWRSLFLIAAAASFQFAAIYIASLVD